MLTLPEEEGRAIEEALRAVAIGENEIESDEE